MTYEDLEKKYLSDPEVKAEFDALEPEYQFVRAVIDERIRQNLTQQNLADITGINRADISKLEHGNANPSLKMMKRIAAGLGKKLKIEFC